jgi:hypothetical protein
LGEAVYAVATEVIKAAVLVRFGTEAYTSGGSEEAQFRENWKYICLSFRELGLSTLKIAGARG